MTESDKKAGQLVQVGGRQRMKCQIKKRKQKRGKAVKREQEEKWRWNRVVLLSCGPLVSGKARTPAIIVT